MFADDTCCLDSDENLDNLIRRVNDGINKIAVWFKANKMAINTSKTKYIIFRSKNKKINLNGLNVYYDANDPNVTPNPDLITPLERYHNYHENKNCRQYKLLGIYLDEYLSLDFHVDSLCSKINRSLYCIKQAKNNLTQVALKALYFALVHSHLTYCPIILSCTSKSNINRISKIQKKAIRIITHSNYNDHTAPLFVRLGILPYEKLIEQAKLLFMHSIEYNYAPRAFSNTWMKNNERNIGHALRNDNDYMLPNPRIEFFKKIPLYSLPSAWNDAGDIRYQQNRLTFKIALKEKLLDDVNND
jgi:hypothetical protein